MSDAIFEADDNNAVIRVYPSHVPGLSGSARRAVIAALLPSLQAHAEYLSRITGATWTVVDAEAQDELQEGTASERGRLLVNGHSLGPAERDPETGRIEAGPHVTNRATITVGVTGETITDEQVCRLRDEPGISTALRAYCRRALTVVERKGSNRARMTARDRCAAAYNARFGGRS